MSQEIRQELREGFKTISEENANKMLKHFDEVLKGWLTQPEMAEHMGCTVPYISRLKNDGRIKTTVLKGKTLYKKV